MLPYLTPQRYRTMGFGTDDVGDASLRSHINRASLAVDRYCNVPMVPSRYSFRGGAVVDEEHEFFMGDGVSVPQQRSFWPYCKPLKACSSLRIYITNSQYASFDPTQLFVTKDSIEVVSLTMTSVGLFGQYTLPVLGLMTPIARISYTYGFSFRATEEFIEPSDGRTYRAQNQFWDDTTPVVEVNGVEQTTGYTVDKTEGTVTFDANLAPDAVVSITYGYTMPNEVSQAVGLTVASYVGDAELRAKGMSGVQSLRVGEIAIERPSPRAMTNTLSVDLPNEAKQLLDGLPFITVR